MQIPPGYVAFFIRFNLVGDPEPMYTHIGWKKGDPTVPNASHVDAASTALHTLWLNDLTNTYTMGPHHFLVGNDGDPTRVDGSIISAAGSAGGGSLPQNVALIGRKRGDTAGRQNQGRMFVPGVNEAFVSDAGAVSSAAQTAWNANFAGLLQGGTVFTAVETAGLALDFACIFHTNVDESPEPIASLTTDPVISTQRRRLRR